MNEARPAGLAELDHEGLNQREQAAVNRFERMKAVHDRLASDRERYMALQREVDELIAGFDAVINHAVRMQVPPRQAIASDLSAKDRRKAGNPCWQAGKHAPI